MQWQWEIKMKGAWVPLLNSTDVEAAFQTGEAEYKFEHDSRQFTIDFSKMLRTSAAGSREVRRVEDEVLGHKANEEFLNGLKDEQRGQLQRFMKDFVAWASKNEFLNDFARDALTAKVAAVCNGSASAEGSTPAKGRMVGKLRDKVEAARQDEADGDGRAGDKAAPSAADGDGRAGDRAAPSAAAAARPASAGGKGRGRRGKKAHGFGIEDVGQTNSSVVGTNFMKMMLKASVQKRNPTHIDELKKLGFPTIAEQLVPLICTNKAPEEQRKEFWKIVAQIYTKEASGDFDEQGEDKILYKELNRALRTDHESLWLWADYFGLLYYGGVFGACCPLTETLPQNKQTTYRGFAMDPSLVSRYKKGDVFFWQTFVSTSKDLEQSTDFATKNCGEDQKPFIFHLDLPKYNESRFWAFDLTTISEYEEEAEVLLIPYTQFRVSRDATETDGVINVYCKVIHQPFTRELQRITVLMDSNGFDSGTNRELAKLAFYSGMPKFRRFEDAHIHDDDRMPSGKFYDYGVLPRCLDGMAIFTDVEATLEYIKQQLHKGSVFFRFLTSGRDSEAFLGGFFDRFGAVPCEAMVFCSNVDHWKKHWEDAPRVLVTNKEDEAKDYLLHIGYDEFGNRIMNVRDLIGPSYKKTQVWYPWQKVDHGVVYGGSGMYREHMGEGWNVGTGVMPDVPMFPLEDAEE